MTQENKKLLFKDLCSRLPYHVRVKVWLEDGDTEEGPLDLQHNYGDVLLDAFYYKKITKIKPYLRPMSSMTEEEQKELGILFGCIPDKEYMYKPYTDILYSDFGKVVDWLNARHFDHRGLIGKGLAIDCTNLNIY